MEHEFKVGDRVTIVGANYGAPTGTIGEIGVISVRSSDSAGVVFEFPIVGSNRWWYSLNDLKPLSNPTTTKKRLTLSMEV